MKDNSSSKSISTTKLQHGYREVFDELQGSDEPVFVTKHGKPEAVILSLSAYEKLEAQGGEGPAEQAAEKKSAPKQETKTEKKDPLDELEELLNQFSSSREDKSSKEKVSAQEVQKKSPATPPAPTPPSTVKKEKSTQSALDILDRLLADEKKEKQVPPAAEKKSTYTESFIEVMKVEEEK